MICWVSYINHLKIFLLIIDLMLLQTLGNHDISCLHKLLLDARLARRVSCIWDDVQSNFWPGPFQSPSSSRLGVQACLVRASMETWKSAYGAYNIVSSLNHDSWNVTAKNSEKGSRTRVEHTYILSISCFSSNWPSRMKPCTVATINRNRANSLTDKPHWRNNDFRSEQMRWMLIQQKIELATGSTYFAKSSFSAWATASALTINLDVAILVTWCQQQA